MKRNLITLITGAVLIVIFALLLFTFQVRQSEVAVVTTFGRITGPPCEPGLHLRWPWPIQQIYKFDGRIQNFQEKFRETLTAVRVLLEGRAGDDFTPKSFRSILVAARLATTFGRLPPKATLTSPVRLLPPMVSCIAVTL